MSSAVFIRRPILATVCSLIVIPAGAICIPLLPIARYPELTPPFYDRDAVSQTVSALGFIGLCAYLWLASVRKEKGQAGA